MTVQIHVNWMILLHRIRIFFHRMVIIVLMVSMVILFAHVQTIRRHDIDHVVGFIFYSQFDSFSFLKGICDQIPNPCGTGSSVGACTDINQSFSCLCNNGKGGLVYLLKPCGKTFSK